MTYVPDRYLKGKSLLSLRDPGGCIYILDGPLKLPPQPTWHTPHFSVLSLLASSKSSYWTRPKSTLFSCKRHRGYTYALLARGNSGNGDQCQSSSTPLTPTTETVCEPLLALYISRVGIRLQAHRCSAVRVSTSCFLNGLSEVPKGLEVRGQKPFPPQRRGQV